MPTIPARRPTFINPASQPPGYHRIRAILKNISSVTLVFLGAVLLFAVAYKLGSTRGWGITPTFTEVRSVSWPDCIYFSLVTITTLGYGDFRPESYSRVVAGIEAVFGVILMGWVLGRLISQQQERILKTIVHSQMNAETQAFRKEFGERAKEFAALPVGGSSSDRTELLRRTAGLSKAVARYWRKLSELPDLQDIAQRKATGRTLGHFIELLTYIEAQFRGVTFATASKAELDCVRATVDSALTVAVVVEDYLPDEALLASCHETYELVQRLTVQLELKRTKN